MLSNHERSKLIEHLKNERLSLMFGDGMEEEYVMFGFPQDKGLTSMSDKELLLELGHYIEGDSDEQIAEQWKRELNGKD